MGADPLSDLLGLVHLNGALIFRIDVRGEWCVSTRATTDQFSAILPRRADHVIAFHIILEGRCWLRANRGPWVRACPGEAVVLPHGSLHALGDQPREHAVPFQDVLDGRELTDLRHARFSTGEGPEVSLLCGFLGCERCAFDPLFAALPELFHVDLGPEADSLIQNAAQHIQDDAPGARSVRTRLTEVLFMQALRRYVDTLPQEGRGWLAAIRDPVVSRALHAMHDEPCRDWSVQELAEHAASSRSRLAQRFRDVLGKPPMHYLTQLRMQKAARLLHHGSRTVASVADEVGYDSSAAFQRAFKRYYGMPPGAWRGHIQP